MTECKEQKRILLAAAFKELLRQYPFHKISVKMIAESAGMSRPSFYKYFADKYELLSFIAEYGVMRKVDILLEEGMIDAGIELLFRSIPSIITAFFTISVVVMNILANKSMTAKVKTLVVDMLNYGSEAQTYFKYNEADLANSKLTDAQKALETGEVSCTNKQVKGENFYGASLSLEDSILLNLFFKNCKEGYTAKIIFTDFRGDVKTVEKELVPYSGSIYKIVVDDVVLADAFSTVTATIYDANGNVVGSGTDSVESYIARTGNSALNTTIMKFASSAKNYLS